LVRAPARIEALASPGPVATARRLTDGLLAILLFARASRWAELCGDRGSFDAGDECLPQRAERGPPPPCWPTATPRRSSR